MGCFDLGVQVVFCGPGHVGAGAGLLPGAAVQAVFHGQAHQLMVGRVEAHLVNAMAEAVMGVEGG